MRLRTTRELAMRNTRKESAAALTTSADSNSERLSSAVDGEKPPVRSQPLLASLPQLLLAARFSTPQSARLRQLPVRPHSQQLPPNVFLSSQLRSSAMSVVELAT